MMRGVWLCFERNQSVEAWKLEDEMAVTVALSEAGARE